MSPPTSDSVTKFILKFFRDGCLFKLCFNFLLLFFHLFHRSKTFFWTSKIGSILHWFVFIYEKCLTGEEDGGRQQLGLLLDSDRSVTWRLAAVPTSTYLPPTILTVGAAGSRVLDSQGRLLASRHVSRVSGSSSTERMQLAVKEFQHVTTFTIVKSANKIVINHHLPQGENIEYSVRGLFSGFAGLFEIRSSKVCKIVRKKVNRGEGSLKNSVVDPDPHGSVTFAWIRIRNYGSGSGSSKKLKSI